MFELITVAVFIWLLVKTIGLTLKLTWGAAKIIASILMVVALPVLLIGLFVVGGIVLLIPILMLGIAAGIVKACV